MKNPSMINYIKDQPRALQTSFENRDEFCEPMIEIFKKQNIKKVYFVGSGTSYHASLVIRQYFEQFLQVEATVCIPTVFTNYEFINNNKAYRKEEILVIAISQSGTSLSTIHAVERACEEGYTCVALTENVHSLITHKASVIIHLTCGKELIPIETRGYTVTVLTGLLWAVEIAHALKNLSYTCYGENIAGIEKTIHELPNVLDTCEYWYENNKEELMGFTKGAIAGYGLNYVTTLEAALKNYETFHKPIIGFELEEMIHGYEMAFDSEQYIFMIASDDQELNRIPMFRDFLKNLTSHIFLITCEDVKLEKQDLKISMKLMKEMSPIVYIMPFQIIAAKNCENIGYDTSRYPHAIRSFSHKRDGI